VLTRVMAELQAAVPSVRQSGSYSYRQWPSLPTVFSRPRFNLHPGKFRS